MTFGRGPKYAPSRVMIQNDGGRGGAALGQAQHAPRRAAARRVPFLQDETLMNRVAEFAGEYGALLYTSTP